MLWDEDKIHLEEVLSSELKGNLDYVYIEMHANWATIIKPITVSLYIAIQT